MIAYYVRQSKDKKDSISIDTQIEFCDRENINKEEYKIYSDKGFSGKNTDRPDFSQLILDIKSGIINKVIVYRLDRISRSILDFAQMLQIFDEYKVDFVSCTEKLDTSTPAGRMVVNILVVFAQYERESIIQRITDNTYEMAKMGIIIGGLPPLGYDATRTKIGGKSVYSYKENFENSKHLKDIFNMYVNDNKSLYEIAMHFNANNIKLSKSGVCTPTFISRTIKNPVIVKADKNVCNYLELKGCVINSDISDFDKLHGVVAINKGDKGNKWKDLANCEISIGLHEGIIDSDIWLKAQYKIYGNKYYKRDGKSKYTWLSGLTKCAYCGYAMTYRCKKNKTTINEYLCCSGRNLGICDHKESWSLQHAEDTIFAILKNHIDNIEINIDKNKDNNNNDDINLELQIIDLKIERLINNLAEASDVTITYINKAINDLHEQKKKLSKTILKTKIKNIDTNFNIDDSIENWDSLDIEEKKEIARFYIDKIILYRDNQLRVEFK